MNNKNTDDLEKHEKDKNLTSVENFTNIDKNPYDFEEAFELTGHGLYNTSLLWICGFGLTGVMMESLGSGYILSEVQCEFDLSTSQKGLLSSAIFIGIVCSSHLWGYLLDTKGRRAIIMPGALLAAFCSLMSTLAPTSWMFIILRILTGFFISSASSGLYPYVGEMHINSTRTKAIARLSIFISLALILLPAIGWLIIPYNWKYSIPFLGIKYSPWRLYIAVCSLPNLIGGLLLIKYPESPKYLYSVGETEKALDVLNRMYKANKIKLHSPVTSIKYVPPNTVNEDSMVRSVLKQTVPLFQLPLIVCLAMACFGQFTIFCVSSGLYLWIPDILNVFLNNLNDNSITVCEAFNLKSDKHSVITGNMTELTEDCNLEISTMVYQVGISMGAVFCMCYLFIGLVIDIVGKKPLSGLILFFCGLCTLALYWANDSYLVIALVVLLLCSGCVGGVITSIAVDLFPTNLRAMAMSLSLMCGRIGAVVGANVAGVMLENSCPNTFILFGGLLIVCAATCMLWPKLQTVIAKLALKGIPYT